MNHSIPPQIVDTPNSHGMFMLGTTTLYLCHMPMFMKQDHRYQLTLEARLDPESMAIYLADRARNPGQAYNLTNLDSDLFTLPDVANGAVTSYPATIYRNYSNDNGGTPSTPIVPKATVFVDRVVRYRPFMDNVPRPGQLTYVLFGDGREAHLDHYIAADPDFQHLLTLPEVPKWISPSQLQAGVEVTFIGLDSVPNPTLNPLMKDVYDVLFQGIARANQTLRVGATATVWFSTGNMLNVEAC